MATQKPIAVGILLLVILSTSVLITMDSQVRMKITGASATFYVADPANPIVWLISGVEYTKMYSGSTSISRNATATKLNTTIDNVTQQVIVTRTAPYAGGILVTDTWKYKGDVTEKELFPISHTVRVQNAAGKTFRYEVQKLVYNGSAQTLTSTKMAFGRNMIVEWQSGFTSAKLSSTGTLQVNYQVASDDETYSVRLFDPNPPVVNITLSYPANGEQNVSLSPELSAHLSSYIPPCYQETANVSNSCGGLSTGKYWLNYTGSSNNIILVNYTKPANTSNATWQYSAGCQVGNITIPLGCFQQSPLQLKYEFLNNGIINNSFSCYNGTGFQLLLKYWVPGCTISTPTTPNMTRWIDGNWSTGGEWSSNQWSQEGGVIYEEAIWWTSNASIIQNITVCQWIGHVCYPISQSLNAYLWPESDLYLTWIGRAPNTTYSWGVYTGNPLVFSDIWNFTTYSGSGISVDANEAELGSEITAVGTIPGNNTVCIDVLGYGTNLSCGMTTANISFNIREFRQTTDNQSRSSIMGKSASSGMFGSPAYNQTFYMPYHKNSIVSNFTVNLTGYLCFFPCIGLYPAEVRIFVNDTLSNFIPIVSDSPQQTDYYISSDCIHYAVDWNATYNFTAKQTKKTFCMQTPGGAVSTSLHIQITPQQIYYNDTSYAIPGTYAQQFDALVWNAQSFKAAGRNLTTWYPEISRVGSSTCNLNMTIRTVLNNASTQVASCYIPAASIPVSSTSGTVVPCNFNNVALSPGTTYYILSKGQGTCDYPSGAYLIWWRRTTSTYADGQRYRYLDGNWTGWTEDLGWYAAYRDYPYNPWLELGTMNGIREWNSSGYFTRPVNFTITNMTSINTYLTSCSLVEGLCFVPAWMSSDTPSSVVIGNEPNAVVGISGAIYNYTNNPNPISINVSLLERYLQRLGVESANIPITVNTTIQNAQILVSDIKLDYMGGNKTYSVLAHSIDYGANASTNVTFWYSGYNWSFPSRIYYLEFIPASPSSKNVTPYGQSATKPIFNITMLNYGGRNMNWSIWLNETSSCVNITASPTSNKTDGQVLTAWIPPFWCYQEQANVSTACGGLATGRYAFNNIAYWYPGFENYGFDGNWNSYEDALNAANVAGFYANYTIPPGTTSAMLRLKSQSFNAANFSLPSACWNYSQSIGTLRISVYSTYHNKTEVKCYNSASTEISIVNGTGGGSAASLDDYYEEAVYWYIDPNRRGWYNLAGNRSYYDTQGVWMWADYNCTGVPGWAFWEPYFYFRGCCVGCLCDEDV